MASAEFSGAKPPAAIQCARKFGAKWLGGGSGAWAHGAISFGALMGGGSTSGG